LDNHTVYSNQELDNWTTRKGLLKEEFYLIDKYIGNSGKVIEAGTGGGRISLELYDKNPNLDIVAFDFVEDMIKSAKQKSSNIDFIVKDASDLSYFSDNSFDYAIYLQQIVSLIPKKLISSVLEESYRILKKDGIIIFSFLYFQGRTINSIFSMMINVARLLRGEKWRKQSLPWLKLAKKPNFKLFNKNQATIYWFERNEIEEKLRNIGFEILEIKTSKEITNREKGADGMLYIVCKK
jgi:ubiquinone/menaquinone biosynthesis C-methylase UbiE